MDKNNKEKWSFNITIPVLPLMVILLIIKLVWVPTMSWWWVFFPLWIIPVIILFLIVVAIIIALIYSLIETFILKR